MFLFKGMYLDEIGLDIDFVERGWLASHVTANTLFFLRAGGLTLIEKVFFSEVFIYSMCFGYKATFLNK